MAIALSNILAQLEEHESPRLPDAVDGSTSQAALKKRAKQSADD
jgi:hypothetical protein